MRAAGTFRAEGEQFPNGAAGSVGIICLRDRHELKIGQDWDSKLDQRLRDADFLIPIITPRFFESAACRDEVNEFLKREEAEGTPDLILPIYWITSPRISDRAVHSTDRLAREIVKHQWGDWQEYRHLPRNNPKWDQIITALASEILARYKENTLRRLKRADITGKIHWPTTGQRVFREITGKPSCVSGFSSFTSVYGANDLTASS